MSLLLAEIVSLCDLGSSVWMVLTIMRSLLASTTGIGICKLLQKQITTGHNEPGAKNRKKVPYTVRNVCGIFSNLSLLLTVADGKQGLENKLAPREPMTLHLKSDDRTVLGHLYTYFCVTILLPPLRPAYLFLFTVRQVVVGT
jgi:hypothetical protein